jgi:hypothetical protein
MAAPTNSRILRTILLLIAVCLITIPTYAKYGGGSGMADDPYQIATAADLLLLGDSPQDYDKHFILTDDIDLDPNLPGNKVFDKAVIAWDTDTGHSGFQGTSFSGVFDGNGHTISNLMIKAGGTPCMLVGLFGYVRGSSAEVKNLRLFKPTVRLVDTLQDGTISNCYIQDCNLLGGGAGLVGGNNGTIVDCHVSGQIVDDGHWVGGLVAINDKNGTITRCGFSGSLPGECHGGSRIKGGLVGSNYGGISFCYSTGSVSGCLTGGLVGENPGVVYSCYSTSDVSGGKDYCAGGLVANNSGTVSNCYSTGAVIHIGFLSTKKYSLRTEKLHAYKKPRGLSVSFCCCVFCSVTPTYRNAQAPSFFFAPAKFSIDSLIESACPWQTSLSCSHPSGSGPRSPLPVTEAPGPIPTSSGPEQRQYRTMFNSCPSTRMDLTDPMTCLVDRDIQPCVTHGAGERDF